MEAISVQWRVLKAMMIRDMLVRFGRHNIGFLWVMLEPMLLCVGVMTVMSFIKPPYEHGVSMLSFIVTGYMPLTLFRHITNGGVSVLSRGLHIRYHRMITLLDLFLSQICLQFTAATVAFAAIYSALGVLGWAEPIHDISLVVGGWLLLAWISAGASACLAALTESTEVAERLVPPIQYLTVPISPIFYMLDWLPGEAQKYAVWNPIASPYEMIRGGIFGPSMQPIYFPTYTFMWGLVMLSIGLWGIRMVKDRVHDK